MRSMAVERGDGFRMRRPVEGLPVVSVSHWLVLALVMEKPSYGYEIGERYDRRFGTFLPTGRTAIYSGLDRLQDVGLVETLPFDPASATGRRRRVRIRYGPTREAAAVHRRWLTSPVNPGRWHHELLARIGTAHLQGPSAVRELLGCYAHQATMHKRRIEESIADRSAGGLESLQALTAMLLLAEQQGVVAAQLDWVGSATDQLVNHGLVGR